MKIKLTDTALTEYIGENDFEEYQLTEKYFQYTFKAKCSEEDESLGMRKEKSYDTIGVYRKENICSVVLSRDSKHEKYYVLVSVIGCHEDITIWANDRSHAKEIQKEILDWL